MTMSREKERGKNEKKVLFDIHDNHPTIPLLILRCENNI